MQTRYSTTSASGSSYSGWSKCAPPSTTNTSPRSSKSSAALPQQHLRSTKSTPAVTAQPSCHTCTGVTQKGAPCKRRVRSHGGLCHLHDNTTLPGLMEKLTITQSTSKLTRTSPGYIYMYTIDVANSTATPIKVYDHATQRLVPIASYSISDKNKHKRTSTSSMWKHLSRKLETAMTSPHHRNARPPELLLVKVGYTRKLPAQRLQEWRNKCRLPIQLLTPPPKQAPRNYVHRQQGWLTSEPAVVEKSIHAELRGLLGSGYFECLSCKTASSSSSPLPPPDSAAAASTNTKHREWYLVNRTQMGMVFNVIGYWTSLYKVPEEYLQ